MSTADIIECSICYETFCKINVSITPCGHEFCFNCIIKAISYNKECPICRTRLAEESDDEDEDEDETDDYDDDDDDDIDTDDDDDEGNVHFNLDSSEIAERLEKKGFRFVDIVSLLEDTPSRTYHTKEQFKALMNDYNKTIDEVYGEKYENYLFEKEDKNVLAI